MRRHSGFLQASLCMLLVGASLLLVQAQDTGYPRYSPCAPWTLVNKASSLGDPFVVGIAYWPGGTVLQWGPATTDPNGVPGYNPCLGDVSVNGSVANYQTYLNEKKVYFSTYSMSVDTMTSLRTTKLEEDLLFEQAKQQIGGEAVISVIAFRGNIRSEAQYIRSASSTTVGQGVVNRLGLIATMDTGNLTALNWYNFDGCNDCGGAGSSTCIQTQYDPVYQVTPQESCATPLDEKACTPCTDKECKTALSVNCSTTVITAFRGASKSGQPYQSAYQLQAAFKYSVYDLIDGIFTDASEIGEVTTGPAGQGVSGGAGTYLESPPPGGEPTPSPTVPEPTPVPAPTPVPEPTPVPTTDPTIVPPTDPNAVPTTVDPTIVPPVVDPAAVPVTDPVAPPATDYTATDYGANNNKGSDYGGTNDYGTPPAG